MSDSCGKPDQESTAAWKPKDAQTLGQSQRYQQGYFCENSTIHYEYRSHV